MMNIFLERVKNKQTYFWYPSSPCSCDHPFLWKPWVTWRPPRPPPPLEHPWWHPRPPRLCGSRWTGRLFSHSARRHRGTRFQDEALSRARPSLWRCRPPADSPRHLLHHKGQARAVNHANVLCPHKSDTNHCYLRAFHLLLQAAELILCVDMQELLHQLELFFYMLLEVQGR